MHSVLGFGLKSRQPEPAGLVPLDPPPPPLPPATRKEALQRLFHQLQQAPQGDNPTQGFVPSSLLWPMLFRALDSKTPEEVDSYVQSLRALLDQIDHDVAQAGLAAWANDGGDYPPPQD